MGLPEGEKSPFASAVRTGDTVQVDFHGVFARAGLVDDLRQTFCPFTDKLPT
jgi:hypothetical protein